MKDSETKKRKGKPAHKRAVRFSVSVPKEQADWLKKIAGNTPGKQAQKIIDNAFESAN